MGSDKPLVEDCLTLDLARLMRMGPIREGQAGSGEYRWSFEGDTIGAIRLRLDLRTPAAARLILFYRLAQPDGSTRPTKQTIALAALPQHFGGLRWWMLCPVTGQRVRTLHLPPGGDCFASRAALGLSYRVERLTRFDRPFEKLLRVQRRLGQAQGLGAGLERPKGMWQRTFARHTEHFAALDMTCAEKIAELLGT